MESETALAVGRVNSTLARIDAVLGQAQVNLVGNRKAWGDLQVLLTRIQDRVRNSGRASEAAQLADLRAALAIVGERLQTTRPAEREAVPHPPPLAPTMWSRFLFVFSRKRK